MSEELDRHLLLNSNRLRILEDARLEVVTYVEAKSGSRIQDSKPTHQQVMEVQITWMLMQWPHSEEEQAKARVLDPEVDV